MGQRVIPVAVTAEYIGGDGVTLGAAGSHNSVLIEYDFRSAGPQWDDISGRYVLWTNPQGNNTNRINLGVSEKVEGYEGVYQAAPPADAMCVPGWAEMVVVGFTLEDGKEVTKIKTEPSRFRVLPGSSRAADNEGIAPTVADQLQAEIEAVEAELDDKKVNKPTGRYPANGSKGQFLESLGGGATRWANPPVVTEEQVDQVLSQHPDWVTTVQDGGIAERHLASDAVTSAKMADGAITEEKLADDAVSDEKLSADLRETILGLKSMTLMDKVAAHAGFINANNIYAQPNSQAAFAAAGSAGFGAIECDPRKDVNGKIVLLHDDTVDRVSWQSGEIQYLDSSTVYYKTKAGIRTNVPLCTLDDAVSIAKMFGMMIFFDMGKNACTVQEVTAACEDLGFYRIGFFGLTNDYEYLGLPDYPVKILGGYTVFNPSEEQIETYEEIFTGKNYGVRTQQGTTTAAMARLYKEHGFINFLSVSKMGLTDPVVRDLADYILADGVPYIESGNTGLTGSYARNYGAVNLFKIRPNVDVTQNGVNIKTDASGAVTITGTYTGTTNQATLLGIIALDAGTYILNGGVMTSNNVFSAANVPGVTLQIMQVEAPNTYYADTGSGVEFNIRDEASGEYMLRLHINAEIATGHEISGLVLRPMVRYPSVVSDGFAPYAMTNKQLTDALDALTVRVATLEG